MSTINHEKIKHSHLDRHKKTALVQEEFAHKLLEYSAVPTFVIDNCHRVILWNMACEELTGITSSEVLGSDTPWKAFYPQKRVVLADFVIDGSKGDLSQLYAKYSRSSLSPDGLQAEGWYKTLNGTDHFLIFDAAPVRDNEGKIIAAIQTLRDITVRKQAEESLRILLLAIEQSSKTIIITNRDGIIKYVNSHFTKTTGYSSTEAVGNTPRILKSNWHTPTFYRDLWRTILAGNEPAFKQGCNRRKLPPSCRLSRLLVATQIPSFQ